VVDDEYMVRQTVGAMVESMGHRAILASNGLEAIEVFRRGCTGDRPVAPATGGPAAPGVPIDLVVLDMMMPDLNGLETFTRLQQIDPQVKAIVSTGYAEEDVLQQSQALGIKGVVGKPYNRARLLEAINEALKT
jgi:CheY-like chemotaxis protein